MKSIMTGMVLFFSFTIQYKAQEKAKFLPQGPRVIPIMLDEAMLESMGINPGDSLWFEMFYSGSPNGKVIHEEVAEKLWWIQDKPLLLLGSTGIPLPPSVTRRSTAFLKILFDGKEINGSPFPLEPQKEAVVIGLEPKAIQKTLSQKLLSINATYLSQVANYLAQNVATLDVQGSSYSVDEVGTVINSSGEWVGDPTGPVGAIVAFGGTVVPAGWLPCDGTVVVRADYVDLYAVIGDAYGEGDGTTTFHLPDLRGRFPRGVDGGIGRDPDAASRLVSNVGGNAGDAIGSLQDDSVQGHRHNHSDPGHSHGINDPGHDHNYYGWIWIGPYATGPGTNFGNGPTGSSLTGISINYSPVNIQILSPATDGINGTVRTSSETRPQNLAVHFIIKY